MTQTTAPDQFDSSQSAAPKARIKKIRDHLLTGLVERDVAVRLALLAALSGEHLLLLGPPGTAKSLIARRLHLAFGDSTYFERLLTRFTVPEELFGPLSIKGLEQDEYTRLTEGYLPRAAIGFLDEIFKANSAILNALLTLLNEREFDNGVVREKTPLVAVIGASNELPESEELDALYDRFLLRLHVGPVSKDGFRDLLGLRGQASPVIPESLKFTAEDLQIVQQAAEDVKVPEDVLALLGELRDWCTAEEIPVSDRRWRKVVKLLQVSAWTNGRDEASIWDCWLLQHCLWNTPESREKVFEWYASRVGASSAMDPSRLTKVIAAWESQLDKDKGSRSQMRDNQGRPLYRGANGGHVTEPRGLVQAKRGDDPLFLAPSNSYAGDRYRHSQIRERTNGGDGYTRAELNNLYIDTPYNGNLFQHWEKRGEYIANTDNWLTEEVDSPPVLEPTRHKGAYVRECIDQLRELESSVKTYQERLLGHIDSLENEIREHLWVTTDFVLKASESLQETRRIVDVLAARAGNLIEGYRSLPREDEHPAKTFPVESASHLDRRGPKKQHKPWEDGSIEDWDDGNV